MNQEWVERAREDGRFAIAVAIVELTLKVEEGNTQLRRIADMLDQASNEGSGTRP
jgi:hypothetical protein